MYARTLLGLVFTLLCVSQLTAQTAEWPQWRGPNRDGVSKETGLLKQWPTDGPPLVWKAAGAGTGYSSLAISAGRIYTMGVRGEREYVIAFDVATGKELWATAHGHRYKDDRGDGPRGTPTVDDDRVYSLGGNGDLSCIDTKAGRIVWSINVLQKFGGKNPNWGISESPLIIGDKLLINPGGPGASVVALNKKDGSLIWKSESDEAGYSSAMPVQVGSMTQVVFFTDKRALGC
jgi:outer membrane protein assembly factor BamB